MSVSALSSFARLPQVNSANRSAATSAFLDALQAGDAGRKAPGGSLASALPTHRHQAHGSFDAAGAKP